MDNVSIAACIATIIAVMTICLVEKKRQRKRAWNHLTDNAADVNEAPSLSVNVNRKNKRIRKASENNKIKSGETYDTLLVQATSCMMKISNIVESNATTNQTRAHEIFSKYIVSELCEIENASNKLILRQTKRRIEQVLLDTWKSINSNASVSRSQAPSSPQSSITKVITAKSMEALSITSDNDVNEYL